MRKYLALMRGGFLEGIAYKENFLIGLMANFIQVVVLIMFGRVYFFIIRKLMDIHGVS